MSSRFSTHPISDNVISHLDKIAEAEKSIDPQESQLSSPESDLPELGNATSVAVADSNCLESFLNVTYNVFVYPGA